MRYIAESSISFSIKVKGRNDSVRVSFLPLSTGGSTYSTESEAVIEAMESSPMYGKFYQRAPECINESIKTKKEPKEAAPRKKTILVDSVESWQEAVEYLVENFESNAAKLTTPDDILREGESKGVVFTKLN